MNNFKHHNQPYGTIEFTVESVEPVVAETWMLNGEEMPPHYSTVNRAKAGWVKLSGIVVKGGVTNRLFHHTSFTDYTGQDYSLEVSPDELERGYKTSVAG